MKKATVIITRYEESNNLIIQCIEAISSQKNIDLDVYFLDQKNDEIIKKLCKNR